MSIKVKICGITSPGDALAAVRAGADLLGMVFYEKSPRHVTSEQAATICQSIPPYVLRVGLFVNPSPEQVTEAIHRCGLQMLQFHGEEPPEFCRQFSLMSMKAFRVKGPETLEMLKRYATDAWLLDAHMPGEFGGTGHTFDWQLASRAVKLGKPVFLAGGLTPENVGEAVKGVHPYGVDVSSGVEVKPGKKDPLKLAAFIAAAKNASRAD